MYGEDRLKNAVHGSDSTESASRYCSLTILNYFFWFCCCCRVFSKWGAGFVILYVRLYRQGSGGGVCPLFCTLAENLPSPYPYFLTPNPQPLFRPL